MTIDECVAMYPGCVVEGDYIAFPPGVYMKANGALYPRVHVWALDTTCPIVRLSDEEWVREWVRRTPGAEVAAGGDWVSVMLPPGYVTSDEFAYLNHRDWSKVREALGGVTLTLPYKPMEG